MPRWGRWGIIEEQRLTVWHQTIGISLGLTYQNGEISYDLPTYRQRKASDYAFRA